MEVEQGVVVVEEAEDVEQGVEEEAAASLTLELTVAVQAYILELLLPEPLTELLQLTLMLH